MQPFDPYRTPFDHTPWIEQVPEDAVARGMFLQDIQGALSAAGKELLPGKWIGFKTYPWGIYYDALLEAARRLYPDEPLSVGLFELGTFVYPNFASTMIGRAIFSVAGVDVERLINLSPRAYAIANNYGEFIVEEVHATSARWRLKGVWDLPPYSLGIINGAFKACGAKNPRVEYVIHDVADVEIRATWEQK